MRRSTNVIAPLLASSAVVFLAGCGPQMQRCIDEQNRVSDPAFCKDLPVAGSEVARLHNGAYRYYYGGSGDYEMGTYVTDGAIAPAPGQQYSLTDGTSRKGFGTFFSDNSEMLIFVAAFGIVFVTASAFNS